MSLISSAKPENEEVQVASVAEDSQTNSEENSDATSVSTDEDSTNEEATEEEKKYNFFSNTIYDFRTNFFSTFL